MKAWILYMGAHMDGWMTGVNESIKKRVKVASRVNLKPLSNSNMLVDLTHFLCHESKS